MWWRTRDSLSHVTLLSDFSTVAEIRLPEKFYTHLSIREHLKTQFCDYRCLDQHRF